MSFAKGTAPISKAADSILKNWKKTAWPPLLARRAYSAALPETGTTSPTLLYDHIEVVRGAAGLTQSNSAPGGTINAVRKKPTAKKQISMNGLADRFGKRHIELDASGTLSPENQLRGRIVGSFDHDKPFRIK